MTMYLIWSVEVNLVRGNGNRRLFPRGERVRRSTAKSKWKLLIEFEYTPLLLNKYRTLFYLQAEIFCGFGGQDWKGTCKERKNGFWLNNCNAKKVLESCAKMVSLLVLLQKWLDSFAKKSGCCANMVRLVCKYGQPAMLWQWSHFYAEMITLLCKIVRLQCK